MAIAKDTRLSKVTKTANPRVRAREIKPVVFGPLAGGADVTYPQLTPVAYDSASGKWAVWSASGAVNEVNTITSASTPATAGDFTLTVAGETTAAISYDATAAAVQAALEALGAVDVGDVAAAAGGSGSDLGDADHVVTLTWGGQWAGKNVPITADFSGLTGNAHVLATTTQGSDDETDHIKGFLWPNAATLEKSGGDDVVAHVLVRGRVSRHDVQAVRPAGESEGDLDTALRDDLALRGLDVEDLDQLRYDSHP